MRNFPPPTPNPSVLPAGGLCCILENCGVHCYPRLNSLASDPLPSLSSLLFSPAPEDVDNLIRPVLGGTPAAVRDDFLRGVLRVPCLPVGSKNIARSGHHAPQLSADNRTAAAATATATAAAAAGWREDG